MKLRFDKMQAVQLLLKHWLYWFEDNSPYHSPLLRKDLPALNLTIVVEYYRKSLELGYCSKGHVTDHWFQKNWYQEFLTELKSESVTFLDYWLYFECSWLKSIRLKFLTVIIFFLFFFCSRVVFFLNVNWLASRGNTYLLRAHVRKCEQFTSTTDSNLFLSLTIDKKVENLCPWLGFYCH